MALAEKELEVRKEYLDTLNTLNCNSKPLIDVLTDVAEENKEFARVIVKCIEDQLEKVSIDLKLPILYLIDSIMKSEQDEPIYKQMFCYRLHLLFAKVYKEGKDEVRNRLSKLRFTWNGILPPVVLSAIDNEVRKINPTWPSSPAVHVNPKFIPQGTTAAPFVINSLKTENATKINPPELAKKEVLIKRKELDELKKKSEQLERMKSKNSVISDEKSDRLSAVANQVFSDMEKLKSNVHNPVEVQKVRETAIAMKNSLLKSLEKNSKDFFQSTHDTLNDLIKKLDETIKVLSEMEKNPSKRKVIMDKNHLSTATTTLVTSAPNPPSTKTAVTSRVWTSRNASASSYMYTRPASNGTSTAPSNSPTFRIAPVSSQLIHAVARRPRDPRIRKIEEHEAKMLVSNVTTTKEVKLPSAPFPIDSKNDQQNVLLTDMSKTKELISETTTVTTTTSTRELKSSDLKPVVTLIDRENDRRPEKNVAQTKLSKSNHVEFARREASPALKSSTASSSAAKKIELSSVDATSKIEANVPTAPSIAAEKPSTSHKKDSKGETKPTKVRVKVVKNMAKERTSKSSFAASSESVKHSTSKFSLKEKTVATLTREERQKKFSTLADALVKGGEIERRQFIEQISKNHPKTAQKLEKLVKKKMAAAVVTIVDEVQTPPPPSVPKKTSSVVDALMDITDDKNDLVIVSGPNALKDREEAMITTTTKLDQSAVHDDVTQKQAEKVESECAPAPIPMEICEDDEKETMTLFEKEECPSETEEKSDKSACKPPTSSMNLSEQLEAVMNAATTEAVVPSSHAQDVDIRSMLPNSIGGLNLSCSLPVVSDIIAPTLPPVTTDSVATTAAPFNNPFGLSQAPTKDIDYRQLLFQFPLPTIPTSNAESTVEEVPIIMDRDPSPPLINDHSEIQATASASVTAPVLVATTSFPEKSTIKRKPDDNPCEEVKRRRTISGASSGGSDCEPLPPPPAPPVTVSGSPELQQHQPVLPPLLENILNVPSDDSEDEANLRERLDGDNRTSSSYSLAAVLNEDEHSSDASTVPPMEPRPASKSPPPMFPMLTTNPNFSMPSFGMFMSATPEILEANPDVLKMIRRDPVRKIHIDGISREIRHYGSTAVTFLNWDDPRQISFYNGLRKIIIDNDIEIPCYLNGPDVECKVYGVYHRFRLGAPTRELYIDGIGYECYFDGSSKKIRFGGSYRSVRLGGGPPRVHIGQRKRQDLVAGKIDIIIDEEHTIPVYLDAKPQAIYVNGVSFVLMFIDSLKRVLINDVPFRTAFGGLSQSFKFRNKVYYFRFDILPAGIVPGAVSIFQMIMTKLPSPPPLPPSLQYCDEFPLISNPSSVPNIPISTVPCVKHEPEKILDKPSGELKPPPMNNLLESVNIDELFQKLVASGIVPTLSNQNDSEGKPAVETKSSVENTTIKFVDFSKPETLKQRQPGLIFKLYSGIQCGSCGLRFPHEQTVKYSQHLDWHFRLNRRGKDGARMIHSRKWYYNNSDWMQFQEMEDNSDRGTSWFESQAATEYTEKEEEIVPCVSAADSGQDAFCVLCQDKFEQFYNEDIDEWQLRNALRVDGTVYHPTCYQDHMDKENNHSDIEEIVDLDEPIAIDDTSPIEENTINLDDTTVVESDNRVVESNEIDEITTDLNGTVTVNDDSVVIKREKSDVPKLTELQTGEGVKPIDRDNELPEIDAVASVKETEMEDEDSDIEEVQLIEQPIEEIVINDDVNDLEPNLETLNVEDIIAVQQEIDALPKETIEEVEATEIVDKIVDITNVPNIASIDGNIEMGDSRQVVNTATKIKINIAKASNLNGEKAPSPPKSPSSDAEPTVENETEELSKEPLKELNSIWAQPLPPGEEPVIGERKPRLKERKLTEYPPVTKGTEISGLCSIM